MTTLKSTEVFRIEGPDVDLEGLRAEIERRAGPGPDDEVSTAAEADEPADGDATIVATLLRSLAEDVDVARGFPPQSHRALGSAVVAAKKGFRKAFQPILNDALARQKAFNRRLLDLLSAMHAENERLDARLRAVEGELDRIREGQDRK